MKGKSIIHVLDDNTINKIAAGEVVERPASVVKELVENAMDAGATRIEVEVMAGGTSFMRVTDNGKGMSEADARMAIQRHATSKIQEVSDLNTIGTLGFRGEALPTIASVSRFSMLTRPQGEDLGTRVDISGGKEPEFSEAGCSLGTTIKVEDLFFNTPARKKFLKTNHTEGAHINDFIVKLALSRPDIEFHFINNNKKAVVTPGKGNLFDTIGAIYGPQAADSLLAVSFEDEEVKITGFITKPTFLKSSRGWQTYIVNGRIVQNRAIAKAIDNAYKSLIPKSGYPLAVLKIEVPQRTIDVNVHPQKSELKFEDESRIFKAVYKSVRDAIRPAEVQDLTQVAAVVERPKAHFTPQQEPMEFVPATEPLTAGVGRGSSSSYHQDRSWGSASVPAERPWQDKPAITLSEAREQLKVQNYLELEPKTEKVAEERAEDSIETNKVVSHASVENASVNEETVFAFAVGLMPIGQVALTYIVAQDGEGLYIIDQHAAHERILFDHLCASADKIPSQQLLLHQVLTFDSKEYTMIEEHQELFGELGFALSPAGDREMRLSEIPADVPVAEAEDLIREILGGLHDLHSVSAAEIRQHVLATTACRAAIKAGEVLNLKQMQILLEELMNTAFPYTCPHGRPTILKFSSEDLAKMFKRTGFNL
ncbi:DNA mismatch repair endonuclease MutL [Selenomonas sp. KH1T6]|uniref:DNA mismatch repair endonuclease MutL n=1 Tax=Selenomonas sp. KH1T6 TaxID=3158784 RepID=UPI0008A743BD|nr:DNA mismatch repair protein MutL [Selenomonas ruminantium]